MATPQKRPKSNRRRKPALHRHCSLPAFPKFSKRLTVYVIERKFEVVRKVAREFGFKVTNKLSAISDADMIWNETSAQNADILSKMKNYQKLNHFPGMARFGDFCDIKFGVFWGMEYRVAILVDFYGGF